MRHPGQAPVRGAKLRLAGVLSAEERAALAEAMLADVLDALSPVRGLAGVMLVTGDPGFQTHARARGLRVLDDPADRGTAAAVSMAAAALAREGVASLLVVHADLPLATSASIEAVLAKGNGERSLTLVADEARRGTNVLLVAPPRPRPLRVRRGQLSSPPRGGNGRGRETGGARPARPRP